MHLQEILGMVEEKPTSTHMFEERKSQVQKTIQKNRTCVMQITPSSPRRPMPKLDVLRRRNVVGEFIRGWGELERVVHVVRKGKVQLEEAGGRQRGRTR